MELKPFLSNTNSWRNHFEKSLKNKYNVKSYHVVQSGSGFPESNIVSVSPTQKAEDIAKSELIEINKVNKPVKRKYKQRKIKKSSQKKANSRRVKVKSVRRKKKQLSHKRKKKRIKK